MTLKMKTLTTRQKNPKSKAGADPRAGAQTFKYCLNFHAPLRHPR